MAYAQGTTVSVIQSKADIERLLTKRKAKNFAAGSTETTAVVAFELDGRMIRIEFPMPHANDPAFKLTPTGRERKNEDAVGKALEDECKRRWRALLLILKAKLEAIESKISTTEREFLANIVVPGGKTLGDWAAPQIKAAYESGVNMPPLLPGTKGVQS